ncbi:MAG: hypothetical protein ACHP84_17005 [Caulobacterales bacterium]
MASTSVGSRVTDPAERNLALFNYALLFAGAFFAGIPSLLAVIIAYAQRREAPAPLRSHYGYQIRIFWVAFGLALVAACCAVAAGLMLLGSFVDVSLGSSWTFVWLDPSQVRISTPVIDLAIAAGALSVMAALWLIAAPAVGFIRLASRRGMGESGT